MSDEVNFFKAQIHVLTDGSWYWKIFTPEGVEIASADKEAEALEIAKRLNKTLTDLQCEIGSSMIVGE